MNEKLKARLEQAFELTSDLVSHLDEGALGLDLPRLPSNRIAGQVWCIVGARESYTKAILAGMWRGFACTLSTPRIKRAALLALQESHSRLTAIDFSDLTEEQADLGFALLEHEVQHHGQLIRYVYANGLTFPESWNRRYTV